MKKNRCFISLGSNQGDRGYYFKEAIKYLKKELGIIKNKSNIYETKAWGFENQPDFWNQILEVKTNKTPFEILDIILNIENKLGRTRTKKWSIRNIDIDLLFYNKLIINDLKLKVPHKHFHERNFVLIPMMEIAPDFVHPIFNKPIKKLVKDSKDKLKIKLINN